MIGSTYHYTLYADNRTIFYIV